MTTDFIREVFTYAEAEILDQADEVRLIEQAQQGDEEATLTLLRAYGPALRAAVSRFGRGLREGTVTDAHAEDGTPARSIEDLRQTAVVAFLEVLADHDPALNPRLAGRLVPRLNKHLADEVTSGSTFAVPERTLSRFYGILREADGDPEEALAICGDYGMTPETFQAILAAVQSDSLDDLTSPNEDGFRRDFATSPVFTPSPVVDVEDKILVEMAFRAVDDEEERICRLSYGFTEYEPQPDAEIAYRMGLTRPTVQRKRNKALGKMRKALGVTHV